MLKLYQFEGCPFCHKVRQYMSDNAIDYFCINVPRNWKADEKVQELVNLSGSNQVPFLVDEEKGVKMKESDEIIAYLQENYQ